MLAQLSRSNAGLYVAIMVVAAGLALPVHAASGDGDVNSLEEVVVTANKRSEPLQSVPMSISAFSGATLERDGITNIQDFGNRIPNLTFQSEDQSRTDLQTSVQIRGVSGAGTTGFYIDDSPLLASLNPRVIELDRIEVLRGPQGTLYGARSMGGTIRYITHQPDLNDFEGQVHTAVSETHGGSFNDLVDGVANLPVMPGVFALRILGYQEHDSGWLNRVPLPTAPYQFRTDSGFNSNDYSGTQIIGLASFLDGALTITPRFMYQEHSDGGRGEADYFAGNTTNARLFDINEPGGSIWRLSTLSVKYQQPYGEFVSATSFFKQHVHDTEDGSEILNLILGQSPPVPGVLSAYDDNKVFSQEFRFTSNLAGPVAFTAGVFYQNTDELMVFPTAAMPPITDDLFNLHSMTTVKETAEFIQGTVDLTHGFDLTAGIRHFKNEVDFFSEQGGLLGDGIPYSGTQAQSGFTPKYGVEYHVDADHLIYANAAKGYRIGGVNSFAASLCSDGLAAIGVSADDAKSFASDSLWSYEVGAKTSWLDHRVTLNTAAFLIDWKNLQQTLGLGNCGYQATLNIGAARSEGFEVEAAWKPANNVALSLGTGYTDAYITNNGGLTGNAAAVGSRVQNVPKWTVNAAADVDQDIAGIPAFAHIDYAYVGDSYNNRNAPRIRPSYDLVNLRTGVHIEKIELALFVKNLTNKAADLGDVPPIVIQYPGRPRIATNTPRTVGLEIRVKTR